MKKLSKILLCFLISLHAYSFDSEIYFMHADFNSPTQPYLETYLSIIGNTVEFALNENGNFQAVFEITTMFKQQDDIVLFDKYIFKSPEVSDTTKANMPNFIDQQRYSLQNGVYSLEVKVRDINSDNPPHQFVDVIQIDYQPDKLQFSEVQLIESAIPSTSESITTKNNFDLVPYVSNFFPPNMDRIMFYVEIYNSEKAIGDDFMLRLFVETFESQREIPDISRFRRLSPAQINPYIGELNIENLASGNYNLVLEVRNRENELLESKRYFFQRSSTTATPLREMAQLGDYDFGNMFYGEVDNLDSLVEYIYSMRPIANSHEQRFIDHRALSAPITVLQDFFYEFWVARDPANPNASWRVYKEQVEFVNRSFSSLIKRGYNTDRGRVYLQYGTPNSVYISDFEPSAYPYEIWHYDRVGNERNRRFVFYNPHLVGDEYELLHSELTGEIQNPNWERLLNKRNHTIYDFDQRYSDDHWGSRARDEFRK